MPGFEKESFQQEDRGSYEITEDNKAVRNQQVKAAEFLQNEIEFIDGSVRQAALSDLKDSWEKEFSLDTIVVGDEAQEIFYTPDNYLASLVNLERKLSAEDRILIGSILTNLERKKEELVEMRLDYVHIKDFTLDPVFEKKIEAAIGRVDVLIENGKKVLENS